MRKLAFGYSTRCNLKCEHCVAVGDMPESRKMGYDRTKEIIVQLARAGVGGISFSAGELFLYINEITRLVNLCRELFNAPETVTWLRAEISRLEAWSR